MFARPATRRKLARARERQGRDAMFRARLSLAHRRAWADPRIRARRIAILRANHARPEVRAKMAATCAITNQRPEVRALRRNPEYRLKLYAALRRAANRPARKAPARKQMVERNRDPEFTRRRLAGIQAYWARIRARSGKR